MRKLTNNSQSVKMTTEQLETIIQEIRDNLQPEDVFTDEQLTEWARKHKEPNQIFTVSEMKASVRDAKMEAKII